MGLKDRLASRKRPTTTYSLRIDSDDVARAELAAAQVAADDDRIAVAQAAVEACYEQVTLTALTPVALEELLAAHPATDKQRAENKTMFNSDTFIAPFLAACVESDVTEAEWIEYTTTGAMTTGEVADIFNAAWALNYRVPDLNVKKG